MTIVTRANIREEYLYEQYFGLTEAPFSIAPNPQYLYMSNRHREALAHLLYGIGNNGFILLTGEVRTGKTTVCRSLLDQLPENVDTAFVVNPKLTADELLATICDDLGVSYPTSASAKILIDCLNSHLVSTIDNDRRTLLIIDEAQNLSVEVLEQLRLLTNLETNQRKLLQIILLGQPELLDTLSKQSLRQLAQRITASFHLDALNKKEVAEYIAHRLSVAGARGNFFKRSAMDRTFALSNGVPRVINLICDRSLLGAFAENRAIVTRRIVNKAAKEILLEYRTNWRGPGDNYLSKRHELVAVANTHDLPITTPNRSTVYSGGGDGRYATRPWHGRTQFFASITDDWPQRPTTGTR